MILGNSKGQNRGKKYFKAKDKDVSRCFPLKAAHFDSWFAAHADGLQAQLFGKYAHPTNGDVFNDTYLRIYERVYYAGYDIADYKSYFCRAFYTNHIQELSRSNIFADPDFVPDIEDNDGSADELEADLRYRRLYDEVFDYVYRNFDIREYEIFKMYMHLKIQGRNMTYEVLAALVGHKQYKGHHIQCIVSKIKKAVNSEFAHRWKD